MKLCHTCQFWNATGDYNRSLPPDEQSTANCMFNPPKAQLVPQQGIAGLGLQAVSYWPVTSATAFCSKWQEAVNEPVLRPS